MIEAKYYKEWNHNYLILKEKENSQERNYQIKMITENTFRYFLPCSIKNINNEISFYYEINSKQSIKNWYEREGMSYDALFHLFVYISEAAKEIKYYMLMDSGILLNPEYIYMDIEKGTYYFVYFPYSKELEVTEMSFVEYLLKAVNRDDEKAVETIYKIYEIVQGQNFVLNEILQLFDTENMEYGKAEQETEPPVPAFETEPIQEREADRRDSYFADFPEKENEIQRKSRVISVIMFILCIIVSACIFCLRYFCKLSVEESLLSIAGAVVFIIIGACLLLYILVSPIKEGKKQKRKEISFAEKETSSFYNYEKIPVSCQEIKKEQREYGATVFLESASLQRENKLYGVNKGNKYCIHLDKMPCIVGKMAGNVDFVIKDESVSRIHARLTKEGGSICVTDLNSTNGTYKNGLRMEPNETTLIETGDEIRFGKMTFCYR